MFLRSDRDGAGRQAGRSSWCSVLSLPQPAGKSPWSWPGAPAYIQWISSLPLNCRRGSPTGTKHLREIWVQKHPGGEWGGGGGLDSGDQYDYPANHTKSSQDPNPCCFLLSYLRASQLQQPLDVAGAYVCEYISINAALTATCCELRPDEEGFKLARHSLALSLSPVSTIIQRGRGAISAECCELPLMCKVIG